MVFSFLALANCAINWPTNNTGNITYGHILARAIFPEKGFNIKEIPKESYMVMVRISGEGLNDDVLAFELTRESNIYFLHNIPSGKKTIQIKAISLNGVILAVGRKTITIIPDILNKVEVEMEPPIQGDVTRAGCILSIKRSSLPLHEKLANALTRAGCIIIPIDDSSPGTQKSPSSQRFPKNINNSSPNNNNNITIIQTPEGPVQLPVELTTVVIKKCIIVRVILRFRSSVVFAIGQSQSILLYLVISYK